MFTTTEKLPPASGTERSLHALTGAPAEDCLFFDIETTGLSPSASFVFLIGCVYREPGAEEFTLRQYLIRHVQEEAELLRAFFDLASRFKILLHFNGQTFDLPFLAKRAQALGLSDPLPGISSVDLYQRYRPLKRLLALPHMNQKTLEQFLGWQREDKLDGAEVVAGYWEFSVSKDPDAGKLLLLHNHDDLLGLMRVPALEGYKVLAEGRTEELPEDPGACSCTAAESPDHRFLLLHFRTALPLPDAWRLQREAPPDGEYLLTVNGAEAELQIPIFTGELLYFLPDYKNYSYLPLENQAIHKSLAAYIPRERRVPARPETCFVRRQGRFLPQPESHFQPALRESYKSHSYYFEYRESFRDAEHETRRAEYLQMLLRFLLNPV